MSSTVKEIKEKTGYLKRSDLYTIGVGQAIGSGVLTLIGPAILLTGQSAWLAYVAACIWGFMMIAPIPWITSTLKLGGGFYSLVGDMAGKRVAGMYAVGFLPQTINLATYGVAIGIFINSCRSLKLPVVIISLIAIVVCMAYGWFRSVSPDVKMETSVWED